MRTTNLLRGIRQLMLLTLLLLFVSPSAQAAMPADTRVSINFKSEQVPTVLKEIQRQSGLNFFYSADLAKEWPRITIRQTKKTAEEVVAQIANLIGCDYQIKNNIVTISRQKLSGRERTIKGYVRDESGEMLVGVPICIGETRVCTVTDADGYYTFKIPVEQTTLKYSYVGMETVYVTVPRGTTDLSREIVLKSDVMLDEVLVTGYQQIEKGRATGSFEVVKPEQLKTVVSSDVVDNLEGVVPGLAVDGSGNMIVRGQATIYAETKPLIVVDGFPMEYGTYNVNPQDIESISVLKDAAAASIWGVRAANGVIVITTKKGSRNKKTEVTYNGSIKVGSRFDVSSMNLMNSAEQIAWEREHIANNEGFILRHETYGAYFTEATDIQRLFENGMISESERDSRFAQLAAYDNTKDIEKAFYRKSLLQMHNVTVSGGSANASNYLSFNFENNLATLKGNDLNRAGIQWNSIIEVAKNVKMTTGLRGNYSTQDTYQFSPRNILPYVHLTDDQGNYVNEYHGVAQSWKDRLEGNGYVDWSYNRLKDRDMVSNNTKHYNVQANLQFDFTLPFGLVYTTSGMFVVDHSGQEIINDRLSYAVRDQFNQFTNNTDGMITHYMPEGAQMDKTQMNSTSYTWRNVLNWKYDKGDWYATAMAGCEMFAIRTKITSDTYYGFDPQAMTYANSTLDFGTLRQGVMGYDPQSTSMLFYNPLVSDAEDRYFSTFFTASTTYKNRYTVFASMRYDKTNLFGRSGKYRDSPTWSVGGMWDISKESFFHLPSVDRLAVKASYGLSGNIDKSTSPYLIAAAGLDMFSGLPALTIQNPENKELRWEKVYTFNLGLDLSMWRNRFRASLDFYNRPTRDALGQTLVDPTVGFNSVMKNTADILNRGVDISLGGTPVQTKDFSWETLFTFSYNYNKVTKVLSGEPTTNVALANNPMVNYPVDYVMVYRLGKLSADGQAQMQDAQGNLFNWQATGAFTIDDLVYLGRLSPKYYGAWSNTLRYKNFDFSMMLTYKLGHMMRMPNISDVNYGGERAYKDFADRWMKAGDEERTWIPVDPEDGHGGTYIDAVLRNDHMFDKGDLFRLKSVGLGYDFSHLLKKNFWVKSLYAKVTAENVWYHAANRDGIDPDNMISLGNGASYNGDLPHYYTLTVNVKF